MARRAQRLAKNRQQPISPIRFILTGLLLAFIAGCPLSSILRLGRFHLRSPGAVITGRAHSCQPVLFHAARPREGYAADIIVYEQEKLGFLYEGPVYATDFPGAERRLIQKAKGIRYTIVNGGITFEESECTHCDAW
jgi:hypothetical protein